MERLLRERAFADDETTYFDDVDQFLTLWKQAVEALAEEHKKSAAWVDRLRPMRRHDGILRPSGAVEVRIANGATIQTPRRLEA